MKEVVRYTHCFVCGDKNEHGLQAKFFYDGEQAVCDVVAREQFEGYRGIYHGGIVSTLLEEVMIKAILAENRYVVRAELTVRFLKPIKSGDKIRFTGRVTKNKGRVFFTEGQASSTDGQVFATAIGRYIEPDSDLTATLKNSVE